VFQLIHILPKCSYTDTAKLNWLLALSGGIFVAASVCSFAGSAILSASRLWSRISTLACVAFWKTRLNQCLTLNTLESTATPRGARPPHLGGDLPPRPGPGPHLRVSTTKQGKSGLGIEAQRAAVANYLNGGNWTIIAEFTGKGPQGRYGGRPGTRRRASGRPSPNFERAAGGRRSDAAGHCGGAQCSRCPDATRRRPVEGGHCGAVAGAVVAERAGILADPSTFPDERC
jgi:hypothetical protein